MLVRNGQQRRAQNGGDGYLACLDDRERGDGDCSCCGSRGDRSGNCGRCEGLCGGPHDGGCDCHGSGDEGVVRRSLEPSRGGWAYVAVAYVAVGFTVVPAMNLLQSA